MHVDVMRLEGGRGEGLGWVEREEEGEERSRRKMTERTEAIGGVGEDGVIGVADEDKYIMILRLTSVMGLIVNDS